MQRPVRNKIWNFHWPRNRTWDDSEKWQKGLASRIDQMWYLEPKWLRWSWHPFSKVNGFWFTELTQKILSRKSCKHLMTRWPDESSRFDTGRSLVHRAHPMTSKNPMSNFLTVGRKLGKLSYRWCLGLKKAPKTTYRMQKRLTILRHFAASSL